MFHFKKNNANDKKENSIVEKINNKIDNSIAENINNEKENTIAENISNEVTNSEQLTQIRFTRLLPNYAKFPESLLKENLKEYIKAKGVNKIKDFNCGKIYDSNGIERFDNPCFFLHNIENSSKEYDLKKHYEANLNMDLLSMEYYKTGNYDGIHDFLSPISFYYSNEQELLLVQSTNDKLFTYELDSEEVEFLKYIVTLRHYLYKDFFVKQYDLSKLTKEEKNLITKYRENLKSLLITQNSNTHEFNVTTQNEVLAQKVKKIIEENFHDAFYYKNNYDDEHYIDIIDIISSYNTDELVFSEETFIKLLSNAIEKTYVNESYLFKANAIEQTLAFHLARYLYDEIKNSELLGFNLDVEYNKNCDNINNLKQVESLDKNYIKPDIIIHQRGSNLNNACAIEIKKNDTSSDECNEDRKKLTELTDQSMSYKYKIGIHLFLTQNQNDSHFDLYINGKCVSTFYISSHVKEKERKKMSLSLRYEVLKRDNFKCALCGRSANDGAKLEVDHIIPISKGGLTQLNNLQTLCFDCNRGKRDKILK